MKKLLYILAAGACLAVTSCDEERLDIAKKASSSTDNFYKTDEDAESILTACYAQVFQKVFSADWSDGCGFGSPQTLLLNYSSDDVFSAGGDITDHFDQRQFDEFRYDAANSQLKPLYQRYYSAIYYCNLIRAYVSPDTDVKARVVAEATVLSAYLHMMLAITFNNPPLISELIGAEDYPANADSQEAIFEWCIKEVEGVMGNLKERSGASDVAGAYTVTKGFAQFLLGKCAMFKGDYAAAEKYLKPLVESSNYSLVPGERFRDLFHVEGDGSEEKIFELNVAENAANGDSWNEQMRGGWMFVNVVNWRGDDMPDRPNIEGVGGWGGGAINDQFAIKMYNNEPNSYRRKATFLTADEWLYDEELCGWPSDVKEDGTKLTLEEKKADPKRGIINVNGSFSRGVNIEVKKIVTPADRSSRHEGNMTNTTIARLGEAYLLYAEACLKNGNTGEGKKYLNKIQERAGAPVTDLSMQTLMDEKQYELWFEGCRFPDLVRWNKYDNLDIKAIYDKVTDNIPYLFDDYFIEGSSYFKKEHHLRAEIGHPLSAAKVTCGFVVGKHEYFPFPADILALNPNLKQHDGWK